MPDYEPLSYEQHGHLKLVRAQGLRRVNNTPIIPIVLAELWQIAREFVIVFPDRPGSLPHALLSFGAGNSPYLNAQHQWQAAYIPVSLRLIPFKLAVMDNGKGALMIAPHDESLSTDQGEPLFSNGKRSALVEQLGRNLVAVHQDEQRTRTAAEALDSHGLLQSRHITSTQGASLSGLKMVDTEAFAKLGPEALTELRQTGGLDLYFAQLASQVNLQLGRLKQPASDNASATLDELFNEGDDDLTFDFDS